MGQYLGKEPTVWMRALRDTKYEGVSIPEGGVYLVHEDMVENIENLRLARREPAPPKARREPKPEIEDIEDKPRPKRERA